MTKTTDYSGSGLVHIKNPHSDSMEENVLYHLDLGTKTHNLPAMFGDIKHGMGIPSISIMLQEELIKLLHHAKCRDVTIICIGTSGGMGIEAGSVVITDMAVDSSFQPRFELVVLGDVVVRSTELDKDLVGELPACSKEIPDLPTLVSHTMCTYDFYKVKFGNVTCKASAAVADGGSRVKIHPAAVAPWGNADARGTSAAPPVQPSHGSHARPQTLRKREASSCTLPTKTAPHPQSCSKPSRWVTLSCFLQQDCNFRTTKH